jgi:D-sedoheptulose 7-phosphate isomerase
MSTEIVRQELAQHAEVVRRVSEELTRPIEEVALLVTKTLRAGGKVLFCGNGGSAADAQHLAAEYVVRFARERRPLPALALTTDTSIITACANDDGFDTVFERQVRALGRAGDLLVLHSTSGRSVNLLAAADAAREVGLKTVGLLAKGGGLLAERVDLAIVVPTESTPRAQELHLTIGHVVCELVDRAFAAEAPEETERGEP